MPLKDLKFKLEYRTGYSDPVAEFYRPSLKLSSQYLRGVGFFSSSALEFIGAPMGEFFVAGGTMKLVTSVCLQQDDIAAIEAGTPMAGVYSSRLVEQIKNDFLKPAGKGAALLTALLQLGRLEIKIAKPADGFGIYHEKVGIFMDLAGDYVAFAGSINESRTAFEGNYECSDVFTSWRDADRARLKLEHFERVWSNQEPGAEVFSFPDAARAALIRAVSSSAEFKALFESDKPKTARVAGSLWTHQKHAIENYLPKKRGVLEMATGTGKTRTALEIISHLLGAQEIESCIVTAEGIDLLEQWLLNLRKFQFPGPKSFVKLRHFGGNHQGQQFQMSPKGKFLVISRSALSSVVSGLGINQKQRCLLICDEVHGFGSPANVEQLDGKLDDFTYRLGLSATPERSYDDDGNAFISRNVGPIVFSYGLKEAIRDGILCEFDYTWLPYRLTVEERQRLNALLRWKATAERNGDVIDEIEFRIKLARIYKASVGKIPPFIELLERDPSLVKRTIVFVEDRDYGARLLNAIHSHTPNYHTYYAEDESHNLTAFSKGEIDCLITCHRISEGIDIRSVSNVILFASARSRLETIQRIGRSLRTDPNNPGKRARVLDFVHVNTEGQPDDGPDRERRAWLEDLAETRRTGA